MDNSVAQGLLALGGVALGAGASFGAVTWTERQRWNRERASRWDAKRLEAYAEYATSVKMSIIQSRSILGSQGLSPTLTPVDRAEGLPVLTEIEAQRTARLEALMLLATDQTIEAARRWHGIAWTFHKWADGTVPTTSEAVESEYAAAQVAREAYYGAVREELAVHLDTP